MYYKKSTVVSYPYPAPILNITLKKKYLNAVNKMRRHGRRCGKLGYFSAVPALTWNDALYRASYEHSKDMLANNVLRHEGSNSSMDWTTQVQHLRKASNVQERIENNGYTEWKHVAENIAVGLPSLELTMYEWENSAHHCANIMNPVFTEFGMAHVEKGEHYWTQNFVAHQ